MGPTQTGVREPRWTTRNRVALELSSVRLRAFSTNNEGVPTLLCAPFALHGSTITDFAPRHSLVAALQGAGIKRLFVTDWRSASSDMRLLSIDNYLAELNVLVDELGGVVDLIGLCQGGWMALVYAARFPAKVRKLALAGTPIDIAAGASRLSELARNTPLAIFRDSGRTRRRAGSRAACAAVLGTACARRGDNPQLVAGIAHDEPGSISAAGVLRFRDWYAWTLDLPGSYYLQVVEQLFKDNRLATGRFVALGRTIDLSTVRCPLFLLAARDDDVVGREQMFAIEHLVDGKLCTVEKTVAPCGHLGLFMGRDILADVWPGVARWLSR